MHLAPSNFPKEWLHTLIKIIVATYYPRWYMASPTSFPQTLPLLSFILIDTHLLMSHFSWSLMAVLSISSGSPFHTLFDYSGFTFFNNILDVPETPTFCFTSKVGSQVQIFYLVI